MKTYSADQLEEVINARSRFAMLACLNAAGTTDFQTLCDQVEITSGNLSQHLARLEEAGYVTTDRVMVDRRPKTMVTLTEAGRRAFVDYVVAMRNMVRDVPDPVAQLRKKKP